MKNHVRDFRTFPEPITLIAMYVPCHQTTLYLQAKAVRLGEAQYPEKLAPVLNWISTTFNIRALNIELHADRKKILAKLFLDTYDELGIIASNPEAGPMLFRYLQENHRALLNELRLGAATELQIEPDSFDRVYLEDALDNVQGVDLVKIMSKFDNIWRINVDAHHFTVFYYTAEQMTTRHANGVSAAIHKAIFDALKQRDQVNIFDSRALSVSFNNKENFDTNYGGKWESYYR